MQLARRGVWGANGALVGEWKGAQEGFDLWCVHSRGPTADPYEKGGPAEKRDQYLKAIDAQRELMELGEAARRKAEEEAQMMETAEQAQVYEAQAKLEAENRRLSFFGRPAQKYRLLKRTRQVHFMYTCIGVQI